MQDNSMQDNMQEMSGILWHVYINGEYVKRMTLGEHLSFNKIYTINNRNYEVTSYGWINHRVNMKETI